MFRKLILTAVLAAAPLAGLAALPAVATAAPPVGHARANRFARFEVLVRHRNHWDQYGTYRDRADARRVARMLKQRGLVVKIERC